MPRQKRKAPLPVRTVSRSPQAARARHQTAPPPPHSHLQQARRQPRSPSSRRQRQLFSQRSAREPSRRRAAPRATSQPKRSSRSPSGLKGRKEATWQAAARPLHLSSHTQTTQARPRGNTCRRRRSARLTPSSMTLRTVSKAMRASTLAGASRIRETVAAGASTGSRRGDAARDQECREERVETHEEVDSSSHSEASSANSQSRDRANSTKVSVLRRSVPRSTAQADSVRKRSSKQLAKRCWPQEAELTLQLSQCPST